MFIWATVDLSLRPRESGCLCCDRWSDMVHAPLVAHNIVVVAFAARSVDGIHGISIDVSPIRNSSVRSLSSSSSIRLEMF